MTEERSNQLSQYNQQIYELDRQIKTDIYLNQFLDSEKEFKKLSSERDEIEEDLKIYKMDENEAKSYLTEKAKELKKKSQNLEDEIDSITSETEKIRADLNRSKNSNEDNDMEKLEVLKSRENDMNEYINSFDDKRKKEVEEQQRLQETIVALLAHISNNMASKTNMPDRNTYEELKNDLDFKRVQAENAEKTKENLKKQLEKQKKDFSKMQDLDVRIAGEVKTIKEKIEYIIIIM